MSKILWTKVYNGFEDISDVGRDIYEAFEDDMPGLEAEFQGKLTITITYEGDI